MSMTTTLPQPNVPAPSSKPRNRDWWIPWTFVWAFLLLFIVDGILAYLAVSTQSGVVIDHAYERGLAYNTYLAEAEAQKARGWQSQITYENGALQIALTDKAGQPLKGATVSAQIIRPVRDGEDFGVALEETKSGIYSKAVSFPQKGSWNVRVSALWQGQPYKITQELVIR